MDSDDNRYETLERQILGVLGDLDLCQFIRSSSGQMRYIGREAIAFRDCCAASPKREGSSDIGIAAVVEALKLLAVNANRILEGGSSGEDYIRRVPRLWQRMMFEWPMGEYGQLCAAFINDNQLAKGHILELGAGVGQASKFIKPEDGITYIKTDKNIDILRLYNRGGRIEAYDIDCKEKAYSSLNLVFCSNVLHCAADKNATLNNVFCMLRGGGHIVFAEGVPYVRRGRPWCLNPLFGFFDGWWNRSGFLERQQWLLLLGAAGFTQIGYIEHGCGNYDLGGVYFGQKPTG